MDETLNEQPSIVKKIPEPEKKLPWVAPLITRIKTEAQGNANFYVDRGIADTTQYQTGDNHDLPFID